MLIGIYQISSCTEVDRSIFLANEMKLFLVRNRKEWISFEELQNRDHGTKFWQEHSG